MKSLKYFEANTPPMSEDDMDHIATEIRTMGRPYKFKNLQASIEEDHILVEVVMNKTEKFNQLSRMFYFIDQIKHQILVGFDVDMDLWETKKGDPIFTLEFYMKAKPSSGLQQASPTKYLRDWEDFYDDEIPF